MASFAETPPGDTLALDEALTQFIEAVLRRLQAVGGEMAGSSEARETEPVEPVADEVVEATLPLMPNMVQAMVRLQRLTGMRPGEVCIMRECDLEQLPDGMMLYRPYRHKTKYKGKKRLITIGPKARLILAPAIWSKLPKNEPVTVGQLAQNLRKLVKGEYREPLPREVARELEKPGAPEPASIQDCVQFEGKTAKK